MIRYACLLLGLATLQLWSNDTACWGNKHGRNMVFPAKNLPATLDERNLLWAQEMKAGHVYSQPAIVGNKLLLGLSEEVTLPTADGDVSYSHGQVLCLDTGTGKVLWRVALGYSRYGVTGTFTVEGDRVYFVHNEDLFCVDLDGLSDGNDGVQDELRIATARRRRESVPVATALPDSVNGDILWHYDLRELKVRPHDAGCGTPLILGDQLWVTTSQADSLRDGRAKMKSPPKREQRVRDKLNIPNIVVMDKMTGKLIALDEQPILEVFHGQWSSLASGIVDGRRLVFWGDGYGMLHAFAAPEPAADGSVVHLTEVWKADGNPKHYRFAEDGTELLYPTTMGGEDRDAFLTRRKIGPAHFIASPVFHEGRLYAAIGRDYNYCDKNQNRALGAGALTCLDAADGSIVRQNTEIGRTHGTPSIADGLLYTAGTDGYLYCVDISDGSIVYRFDLGSAICDRGQMLADGKLYVSNKKGELIVVQAGREPKELFRRRFKAPPSTATAHGNTLYIAYTRGIHAYRKPNEELGATEEQKQ